jgi:hypothetical protein
VHLDSIEWDQVRRLTFVPFLADGRCALIPVAGGLVLPSGEVLAGEDPLPDTGLRVPLVTAGFRRQALHALAGDRSRHPVELLTRLGLQVDGVTAPGDGDGRTVPPTAWLTQRG